MGQSGTLEGGGQSGQAGPDRLSWPAGHVARRAVGPRATSCPLTKDGGVPGAKATTGPGDAQAALTEFLKGRSAVQAVLNMQYSIRPSGGGYHSRPRRLSDGFLQRPAP
jgi:hypothetical protein